MVGKRARSDRSWSGQAWPGPKRDISTTGTGLWWEKNPALIGRDGRFSHSNVTVTFGAAGVPVLPQTRAPFKFTVEFNELAADGAVNATVATHKNIQNAAYQEQPIVYYYI
nr:hypothetical protein Iba_scaffold186CG0010 [Ipomoea batatas]